MGFLISRTPRLIIASVIAFSSFSADALEIQEILEKEDYERDNLFVILSGNESFARLSDAYGMDNPGGWGSLRASLGTQALFLQEQVENAQRMANTPDSKSALDESVISQERVRRRGSEMLEAHQSNLAEINTVLNVLAQLEGKLEAVGSENPVTDVFEIKDTSGRSLTGRVVMLDGEDAIVQLADGRYFRVELTSLSKGTRNTIAGVEQEGDGQPEKTFLEDVAENSEPSPRLHVKEFDAVLVVQGLYPGMSGTDFIERLDQIVNGTVTFQKLNESLLEDTPIGEDADTGSYFYVDDAEYGGVWIVDGVVVQYELFAAGVDDIFNATDYTGSEFAEIFGSAYEISDLSVKSSTAEEGTEETWWEYTDVVGGYKLIITPDKKLGVMLIPKISERKLN